MLSFIVVTLLMSQVTIANPTLPLMFVSTHALTIAMTITIASTSLGLPGVLDWDNRFPPLLNSTGHFLEEGLLHNYLILFPALHGEEESYLTCLVPPDNTVDSESVLGAKPGDSGVVIEYQLNNFTCTQLVESLFLSCKYSQGSWESISFSPLPA